MSFTTLNNQLPPIRILLVEDNSGDEMLMKRAFKKGKYEYDIQVAKSGEVAVDILCRTPPHDLAPAPNFVLLDINLPVMSGQDVLRHIKDKPGIAITPIFVLSSSRSQEDVMKAYELGANAYITKPGNMDEYAKLVSGIEAFWAELAIPPNNKD